MKCKEIINMFLNGETERVSSAEVQEHVEGCVRCRELMQMVIEVEQSGKKVFERCEMPEAFIQRVHQMAVREMAEKHVSWRETMLVPLLARAAMVLIAVGIIVFVWSSFHYRQVPEFSSVEIALLDSHIRDMCLKITWDIMDVRGKITEAVDSENSFKYYLENVEGTIALNRRLIERELNISGGGT
jgi:predicted anti-sigma-YlaC factor YlaD